MMEREEKETVVVMDASLKLVVAMMVRRRSTRWRANGIKCGAFHSIQFDVTRGSNPLTLTLTSP